MRRRVAGFIGVLIVALLTLGLAAIEVHHRIRFGHFVRYGIHSDVVERRGDIGIAGIKTFYAAELFNYTLFPLKLAGWNYVGDVPGPPIFICRFQIQKFSPQGAHWIVVIDFKPTGTSQAPVASKRLYPLASLVPMECDPVGARDALRIGDLVRFAVFTNPYAPEADVYTEPFRISEVRTTESSSARSTQ